MLDKDIDVMALRQFDGIPLWVDLNFNAKDLEHFAKILHGEIRMQEMFDTCHENPGTGKKAEIIDINSDYCELVIAFIVEDAVICMAAHKPIIE